ncbi:MAG: hypothetical protein HY303_10930, partial [Candidatus Wallbacteria bacterium]|nr:hypothetical protein [Candidatus Wallbacteria bacterium]
GALLRTVWWRGTPSVSLPSGQVLLPGGLPVALRLTFPDAPLNAGETPRVLETSRQRLAAGYLGFGEVSTFKVFPFQKVGEKRLRR